MKFSALFLGSIAGALAAVAAFVLYDWLSPAFYLTSNPALILLPLLIAGAQTLFLALPILAALNRFKRLNLITAILAGATSASAPWLIFLFSKASATFLPFVGLIALLGAIGGSVGYATARALSPNNSFKPSPLRGLGAGAKIVPTPRPLRCPA